MRKAAQKLHRQAHTCIEWIEIRFRAWQRFNKPLFYIFAIFAWFFTALAEGAVLDIVSPRMEKGWVVKLIFCLLGALIFLAVFVLAFGQRKKRGFLFWYPWSMVFILMAGIILLQFRQSYTERQFSQILAQTNSLNAASTASFRFESSDQKDHLSNLQKQFDDYKRDSTAEKSDLKMDVIEANRERDAAKQELTFWAANPEKLSSIHSNIFATAKTLDSAFQEFTNALKGIETERPNLVLSINGVDMPYVDIAKNAVVPSSPVMIKKSEPIHLNVGNLSKVPARDITIQFFCNINPTNLMCDGWYQQPQDDRGRNQWDIKSDHLTSQFSSFGANPLIISTNIDSSVIGAIVRYYSDGSITYEASVSFYIQ